VSIARYLEVRYIWIDSLCIIQDDKFDWEREASKMAEIYTNSYLTIGATFSADHSGGCFPSWSTREASPHVSPAAISLGKHTIAHAAPILDTRGDPLRPQLLAMPQRPYALVDTVPDSLTSAIYVHYGWLPCSVSYATKSPIIGDSVGLRYDPVAGEPLNTRGWTLQERLLSSRTLHCGKEQFFWQCRVEFLSEEGSQFPNAYFNVDAIIQAQQLPLSKRGMQSIEVPSLFPGLYVAERQRNPTTRSGRWNGGWLDIVEEYSRRKLTFGKDKLPALAGLARVIANKTQDEYYAGLWRDHILEDLHWGIVDTESSQQPTAVEEPLVPEAYRAPSWSWASCDSSIRFIPLHLEHATAELIHCHIITAGSDPYSELTGGHIKLWVSTTNIPIVIKSTIDRVQAPLFPVHKATSPLDDNSAKQKFVLNVHGGLVASVPVELHLKHDVSQGKAFFDKEAQFPCSALFLDPGNALLLKARELPGEFTRVGIASFQRTQGQREDDAKRKEDTSSLSLDELRNRIPRDKDMVGLMGASDDLSLDAPLGPIRDIKYRRDFVTIL
jgi:hypothetical protein